MFNRSNIVGILLLGGCAVSAAVMIYYISIGEYPSFSIPPVLKGVLVILFVVVMAIMAWRSPLMSRLRGGQGTRQWPDPGTGTRSLWDRLRGR